MPPVTQKPEEPKKDDKELLALPIAQSKASEKGSAEATERLRSPRLKPADTLLSLKDARGGAKSPKRPAVEGLRSLPPPDSGCTAEKKLSPRLAQRTEARKNVFEASIAGKVAVITGASSGIGAAIARVLAANGVKLVLGARRVPALETLKKELEAAYPSVKIQVTRCDVTMKGDNLALVAKAQEVFGAVDIFIANAGVMPLTLLKNVRLEEWDRMVDVNFKGLMYGVASVLPTMLEKGQGEIIAISSDAGRKLFPGGTVYCATKWAVEAFMQGLRQETANTNIRVVSIQPGATESELASHIQDPDVLAGGNAFKGVKILGAEDVANAVLYALSQPAYVSVNEAAINVT